MSGIVYSDEAVRAALRRAPHVVEDRLGTSLFRAALEVARLAREKAPKAFSQLVGSIRSEQLGKLHYRVSTGTNYARAVEEGRPPGKMPGVANGLMEWVRLVIRPDEAEVDRVAFLVARAIGQRGIKPQPYMKPAQDEAESIVRRRADQAMTAAVREILGEGGYGASA